MRDAELTAWLAGFIKDTVNHSSDNDLRDSAHQRAWREPLVGVAAGNDPIFAECKRHIGDFFWRPEEAFALAFPDHPAPAEELRVVAWILPQADQTRAENAGQKVYPSERWVRARHFGEMFNAGLRARVAEALNQRGLATLAPMLHPAWGWRTSQQYSFASNWSERHAAHAAGLGTFGLCDGLITPAGKAVRVGSVITRAPLAITPRPYAGIHDYCLFYTHGTCGKCVPRCPVKALTDQGHDKDKCHRHVAVVCREHAIQNHGIETDCCGLCQTAVPCSDHIPAPEEGL